MEKANNRKLATIITVEYVIGMILCAVFVGATQVSHVVPIVIICIVGSVLVTLNTKITGDTEEKKNRSVVSYSGSIKLVLLLGASFEEAYGHIGTTLLVGGFLVTAIIFFTEMYMFMKNTRNRILKYYSLVMYIIFYVIASMNIDHMWVILFCLPLLTAYSQFENVKLVIWGIVSTDLINFYLLAKYNVFAGDNYSVYSEWNCIIVLVLMITYSVVIAHSTILLRKFSNNKIKTVENEQVRIERITNEISNLNIKIKESLNKTQEITNVLDNSIYDSVEKLEILVDESKKNNLNIEEQLEETISMEGILKQLNGNVKDTNNISNNSVLILEESKKYFEQLKNISNVINNSNRQVMSVINDFVVNAKAVKEIILGITDVSEQTNLLSLNASVESIRAGEVGKGFSVVANEIRKLAEETFALTGSIDDIVTKLEKSAEVASLVAKDVDIAVEEEVITIDNTISEFRSMERDMYELKVNVDNITKKVSSVDVFNSEMKEHIRNLNETSKEVIDKTNEAVNINIDNKEMTNNTKGMLQRIYEAAADIEKFINVENADS